MLPDQLYGFTTAKDSAGGRLELVFGTAPLAQGAAVTVETQILRVPLDRVLLLKSIAGSGIADATQIATLTQVQVLDEASNQLYAWQDRQTAGIRLRVREEVEIWLGPRMGLRTRATFDAGAAINFATFSMVGILFPRGNIQMGAMVIE